MLDRSVFAPAQTLPRDVCVVCHVNLVGETTMLPKQTVYKGRRAVEMPPDNVQLGYRPIKQ